MATDAAVPEQEAAEGGFNSRLAVLLSAAMFVLVVDTSLMNVSISAVVKDLNTTASGVQSAIALEALVSAAFILLSSKIGDLIGRKRAYILGLLGYAVGALAMTLAQDLRAIIIFWAIVGGLGASLLLPAMQSLIHGNFEGAAQKRVYAMVGAASGIAAAIGPLLGGFITTFLSWRVGFLGELIIIIIVLSGMGMVKEVAYTGERGIDFVGALFSILGMGGLVLGILVWEEGGAAVGALLAIGVISLAVLGWWLVSRKRAGKLALIDADLFRSSHFRLGITSQMMQQITLGGLMIALPMFLQMVLEYNALQAGLSMAPLSLSMFAIAVVAGRRVGGRRPAVIVRIGFALVALGVLVMLPIIPRTDSGLWLAIPLVIAGIGLGLLVSQLNNITLAPISEERISEAAGVNSAGGSFGLSFGLALAGAVMLGTLALSFTNLTNASTVLQPEHKEQVATALNDDAELMSNTALNAQLAGQPEEVQQEIIRINTEARPFALQVALLVPLLAAIVGLVVSFRLVKLPDIKPSVALEGLAFD
jgi:EmrB/QacA subfamily drug resistance transporter